MADTKISALTAATLPLGGTEVLPIVQSGVTVKVATNNLTVQNVRANATTGIMQITGPATGTTRVVTIPDANATMARTDTGQTFTGSQVFSSDVSVNGITAGLGAGSVASNTVFGNAALASNSTGASNATFGFQANISATGSNNTTVGHQAGYELTSGSLNVQIGRYAGNQLSSGSSNTYVGSLSTASASNSSNEVVVGSNLTGKGSNTAFIGGTSGAYNGANSATWSVTSDSRIKENVVTLTGALDAIVKLRPVSFNYILSKKPDVSFIAQEYELVFPEQVMQHNASKEEKELAGTDTLYGIRNNLVPYLVSAIQELKAEIELLKSQIGSK